MSLSTWKKEFYPTEAKNVKEADAVEQSLRKWIGLRRKNLAKHGVRHDMDITYLIGDGNYNMVIDGDSCALCQHYLSLNFKPCSDCPLYAALGGSCDYDRSAPYDIWRNTSNPEPMIAALQAI